MTRNRLWGSAVALLVAALAGLAAAAPAAASLAPTAPVASTVAALSATPAGLDDFTFDSFDADYTIRRADDGTSRLRVVETIVADFPEADQNRGIRRSIPDTYNKQPLRAQLVSITDENGRERESEVEDADGAFSVVSRAGDYVHGRQTYVITYTLENVTWNFPDTGLEFYWDVNGVDWAQPFGSVTGRLHVPTELADRLTGTTTCYQGPHGATTRCDAIGRDDEPGGVVVTARASSLTPYQTLTMAVGFAPGTFQMFDASYLASPFGWLQGLVGIGAVGVGVWGLRRRRAVKDAPGRPTLIAEYEPPTTVDALESAVLLGRQSKAIPAEVLEQAVVGSIRIVEGEPGFWGKKPLIAELVDPSRADGDGRLLLQGLFPQGTPGETYTFGRQDTRFSQVAQSIVSAADKELTARGMRRTVQAGTRLWPIAAAVAAVVLAFALAMAAIGRSVHPGIPLAVLGVCVVVVFVVVGSLARRPLSARGAETRDHLLGLESFIAWAEADRIRMLQSPQGAERVPIDVNDPRQKLALYEKLLPYAVVFGQEKEWSKQLSVLYSAVGASGPYWYVGTGSFDASSFATTVGSLSAAASASSSTSGGSSGGGSAGGGGGGGGGGGV